MPSKKDMPCNKPRRSTAKGKKKMVKACANGQEKIIHYGAKGYKHNYSAPANRNFRARHKCKTATNKMSARHWACKDLWPASGGRA